MFIDRVKISIQAGGGGNGSIAFRREKGVPFGGPSGGDGGYGGSVLLQASPGMKTLLEFSYRPLLRAGRGGNGEGSNQHGGNAPDLVSLVPCGTRIHDMDGRLLADLLKPGESFLAAKGGRGGRGNQSFKTALRQAPRLAEKGEPGEARDLVLELAMLADVGLVGFPNAGKSTLLSHVSAARPKVASYPFTTLTPVLGVVGLDLERKGQDQNPGRSFIMADLPGLIEGAHEGRGLGLDFLRHVSRCSVLLFLLDPLDTERTPGQALKLLRREIFAYDPNLESKTSLVALNKVDAAEKPALSKAAAVLKKAGEEVFLISGQSGVGLKPLLSRLSAIVAAAPVLEAEEPTPQPESRQEEGRPAVQTEEDPELGKVYRPKERFSMNREGNDYIVRGAEIRKWVAMTDFSNPAAVERFDGILRKMGVEQALKSQGIQEGDKIILEGFEMEYGLGGNRPKGGREFAGGQGPRPRYRDSKGGRANKKKSKLLWNQKKGRIKKGRGA